MASAASRTTYLQPARQANSKSEMHTEKSKLTEMRRLGFVLTPLVNVEYHFNTANTIYSYVQTLLSKSFVPLLVDAWQCAR